MSTTEETEGGGSGAGPGTGPGVAIPAPRGSAENEAAGERRPERRPERSSSGRPFPGRLLPGGFLSGRRAGGLPSPSSGAASDPSTGLSSDLPSEQASGPASGSSSRPPSGRFAGRVSGRRRIVAGAVLAALLLAAGGFRYAEHRLTDPAATGNRALTDTGATDQVTGDVSNALGKIFAYTPDDTQSTARAARDLLDGAAADQYQALFAQIRQRVADQQLTLTTRVVRAGVVSLTADSARLLVFLDQTAQRRGAAATTAAAQLAVTARLEDGHWRITALKAR